MDQETLALLRAASIVESIVGYDYAALDELPPPQSLEDYLAQCPKENDDEQE